MGFNDYVDVDEVVVSTSISTEMAADKREEKKTIIKRKKKTPSGHVSSSHRFAPSPAGVEWRYVVPKRVPRLPN
jgi:hypothetical protein